MKVVGIIAEYNPFHKGHAYQIRYAKKRLGADYVIVAMSGPSFTQRGTPALFDKYSRAGHALLSAVPTWSWNFRSSSDRQCSDLCYRRCGSFAKCRAGGYPLIRQRMF